MNLWLEITKLSQKTWLLKGKQRKIPTYGKNAGVKLIGILDYIEGTVYCEEHEKYDANIFLWFLVGVFKNRESIKWLDFIGY